MGCGKVRHRSPRHGTWENEGTGKPKRRRARFAPYTGLQGARVPQARLRGQCPRRVPARGRNVRPARRIRCVFVHARPKSRTNPFSHSHAPGLESASAYTKPKRKSGQAALFCICLQSAQCAQAVRTHATANHIRLHCVFALALAFTFTLTFALGFLFCAEKKPSVLFRCMHEKPQVYLQMRLCKMI